MPLTTATHLVRPPKQSDYDVTSKTTTAILAGALLLAAGALTSLWLAQRQIRNELTALRDATGTALVTLDAGSGSWQPIYPADDSEFTVGTILFHVDSLRHASDSSRMWGVIVNPSVLVLRSSLYFKTDTASSCYGLLGSTNNWYKCLTAVGNANVEVPSIPPGRGRPFSVTLRTAADPKTVRWYLMAYTYPVGVPRG